MMIRPEDILQMISVGCPGFDVDLFRDIFPYRDDMDASLDNLCPDPISPSLAVLEPLIPPISMFKKKSITNPECDDRGYSSYARVVSGLLHVFLQDRQAAKDNMWALRHFLALALYAGDFQNVSSAQSPVFDQRALGAGLDALISKVQQVAIYLLTSSADDGWRSTLLSAVMQDKSINASDCLAHFLAGLIRYAADSETSRESRILHHVLQHILDKADKDEADRWVLLARKLEKTGLSF